MGQTFSHIYYLAALINIKVSMQWQSHEEMISLNVNLSTKQHTDEIIDELVTTVKQLVAKEPHIFLRGWWRPKPSQSKS